MAGKQTGAGTHKLRETAPTVGVYCFNTQRSSCRSSADCMRSQRQYATELPACERGVSYIGLDDSAVQYRKTRVSGCPVGLLSLLRAVNPDTAAAGAASKSRWLVTWRHETCLSLLVVITDDEDDAVLTRRQPLSLTRQTDAQIFAVWRSSVRRVRRYNSHVTESCYIVYFDTCCMTVINAEIDAGARRAAENFGTFHRDGATVSTCRRWSQAVRQRLLRVSHVLLCYFSCRPITLCYIACFLRFHI